MKIFYNIKQNTFLRLRSSMLKNKRVAGSNPAWSLIFFAQKN